MPRKFATGYGDPGRKGTPSNLMLQRRQSLARNCVAGTVFERASVLIVRTNDVEMGALAAKSGDADLVIVQTDGSLPALERIVDTLGGKRDSGPFERIRDIRYDPTKSKSIAESTAAHPYHTDGTFEKQQPVLFALQNVVSDQAGGGVNRFISVPRMLYEMPEEFVNAIAQTPIRYSRIDDSGRTDEHVGPILYRRGSGKYGLRWRNDEQVAPEISNPAHPQILEALEWIRSHIATCTFFEHATQQGECVIVNNDAVLHARTALSSTSSERWIRRVWIAE